MMIKFIFIFSIALSFSSQSAIQNIELDALEALYNSTDGSNWKAKTNWMNGDPCINSWYGVYCENNSVKALDLEDNNLVGHIPNELGNLTDLVNLDLSSNLLSSHIPAEFGALSNLNTLDLHLNQLTGSIPSELGNLSNLFSLSLEYNKLTGHIPPELGSLSATFLNLSVNQLTGSIPKELANISNLYFLGLGLNYLSGYIPPEIGDMSSLGLLDLSSNQFSGGIPPELGQLSNLTNLSLSSNQLTGTIPSELGGLTNLEILQIHSNKLSGPIPPSFGNLTNLIIIFLYSNNLSGPVPVEITNLSDLYFYGLNFDYNALYSDDMNVNNFINSHCNSCGDWQATQTLAPENFIVTAISNDSISLNWNLATYFELGGYTINMATDINGPYNQIHKTVSKNQLAYSQGGLSPNQNYYFKINTFTAPHRYSATHVESEFSGVVESATVTTSDNADLWSVIESPLIGQVINQSDDIEYSITLGNSGPDDASGVLFLQNLPNGIYYQNWTCSAATGGAMCPTPANGSGDVDLLLNLPTGGSMKFTFNSTVTNWFTTWYHLLFISTLSPPNNISDTDLSNNIQSINFDWIFVDGMDSD